MPSAIHEASKAEAARCQRTLLHGEVRECPLLFQERQQPVRVRTNSGSKRSIPLTLPSSVPKVDKRVKATSSGAEKVLMHNGVIDLATDLPMHKRISNNIKRSSETHKIKDIAETKRRLHKSPPIQVDSRTKEGSGDSGSIAMTMEEKLRQWKQEKQKPTTGKKNTARPGSGVTPTPSDIKRKLAGEPTRPHDVKPVALRCNIPSAHKRPRISEGYLPTKSALKMKPRLAAAVGCNKPSTSSPVERAIGGSPSMDKENREVFPPNQPVQEPLIIMEKISVDKELESHIVVEKKPVDKESEILPNNLLPEPSPTVEKKPELLAKDLVGVAIGFEKKRRLMTAFSIFKRAYRLLPNENVKLAERLARLQRACPAVVDQVPSQKLVTAIYMHQVLERDLMAVLNDGSKNELTELHSIGDKRAELVLDKRPFNQLEDLQQVPGITANVLAKLYEHHTNWENHSAR